MAIGSLIKTHLNRKLLENIVDRLHYLGMGNTNRKCTEQMFEKVLQISRCMWYYNFSSKDEGKTKEPVLTIPTLGQEMLTTSPNTAHRQCCTST